MKESPMLFSAPMVRATRADLKTKTRRVIKPQPTEQLFNIEGTDQWTPPDPRDPDAPDWSRAIRCPYGVAGDRLWGRETFNRLWFNAADGWQTVYRADTQNDGPVDGRADAESVRWRPSIFMPRALSRITLEIVSIGVERVQEISEADAITEGVQATEAGNGYPFAMTARMNFVDLWDGINAKRGYGWAEDPWVWVVEFKRVEAPHDTP